MSLSLKGINSYDSSDFNISDNYQMIVESIDELGNDFDIVESFNFSFKYASDVETKEQLITAIIMSEEIRSWYLKYISSRTTSLLKPKWLPNNQEGLDNWIDMQSKLEHHQRRFKEWDRGIINSISDLQKRINAIKSEKRKYLKNADPLLVIHSLTVQDLSSKNIVDLVLVSDLHLRKDKQNRYLTEFKQLCYDQWKKGEFENPFV